MQLDRGASCGSVHACVDDQAHSSEVCCVYVVYNDDEEQKHDGEPQNVQQALPPALFVIIIRFTALGDGPTDDRKDEHENLQHEL